MTDYEQVEMPDEETPDEGMTERELLAIIDQESR